MRTAVSAHVLPIYRSPSLLAFTAKLEPLIALPGTLVSVAGTATTSSERPVMRELGWSLE